MSGQVTCCPCVVWNSWATAAKASELGSCGTEGTEFAVTCGGSEGTLAGGGGEPEGLQDHRKGCVTPRHSSCSPQQVSAHDPLCNPQGPTDTTPAAYSGHSAVNCSGHCSHLHLQCTKIETLVPHGILAPSSRFRKALTQTALGNELQCPERGGSASTELGSSFWMNYPNQLSHGSLEEQLSFSQDFPSVTALLQRSLAVIKGFSGLLHKQFSSIKFVHMSLLHMYKPRHTCS